MRSLNVQDLNVLEETVQENKHMLQKFCEGQLQCAIITVCAPVADTETFGESKSLVNSTISETVLCVLYLR